MDDPAQFEEPNKPQKHLFKTGGDQPSPTSFVEGVVRYLDGKLLFRTYLRIITHGAITGATSLL